VPKHSHRLVECRLRFLACDLSALQSNDRRTSSDNRLETVLNRPRAPLLRRRQGMKRRVRSWVVSFLNPPRAVCDQPISAAFLNMNIMASGATIKDIWP